MNFPASSLPDSALFNTPTHLLSTDAKVQLSIAKATSIADAYRFTLDDIGRLSQKFWDFHCDPIVCIDGAATTLLAIQLNLVVGTILDTVGLRADLVEVLRDLLAYKFSWGPIELDHGLDAINIETTATALPNNEGFIIHSPHLSAAKYMPPTTPSGLPCVAIVMARLIDSGVDMGIKPFFVHINDGKVMHVGITARLIPFHRNLFAQLNFTCGLLPYRGGSHPVRHSITSFNKVFNPRSALLQRNHSNEPAGVENKRHNFLMSIWRVAVGSLALSATCIPGLARSAFTVAMYSRRRCIGISPSVPIIRFKTQYTPILVAFAQSFVLAEFYKFATRVFSDDIVDFRVRHGIAACFKAVALRHMQDANLALSERCGAQGLFDYNGISELHANMRGIAIAEGDVLGLSVRLATELILHRYSLECGPSTAGPLSLHAEGMLAACRLRLQELGVSHRSEAFNRYILPCCQPIVEALGMKFAYDAAVAAGLSEITTNLYLASAMRHDEAWYVANMQLTQRDMFDAEERALAAALPQLDEWMDRSSAGKYATAPIVSAERWLAFVSQLPVFRPPNVVREQTILEPMLSRM
ncbi:acyl-CoA dehydrogenase NM domain-like protein [Mycena rebaudengoi]|nr:acyl-CoA dehydrogenase NM domain-like protein [Mycena rebaudengoi]